MFGKVKKILGIEGVKIEIVTDPVFRVSSEMIEGAIKLSTKTPSNIESIHIRLVEKYSRGRANDMLIDEYVLGETILEEKMSISSDEIIEVPFQLNFINARSEFDQMADGNILWRAPVKLAKWIKKVSSIYRLEAHARVEGTKLQPHAEILLKPKK